MYLAVLVDLYSRIVVGWSMSARMPVDHDSRHARRFFESLLDLLDAAEITEPVFSPYADAVCRLPIKAGGKRVATWPVATIIPFLAKPDRHMFLKPSVTHPAAETLGFDLRYEPTPNWRTYEALLRMSGIYLTLLKPKGARDFIDVQSFFWVVGGGYGP
jgi:hypothetical protein